MSGPVINQTVRTTKLLMAKNTNFLSNNLLNQAIGAIKAGSINTLNNVLLYDPDRISMNYWINRRDTTAGMTPLMYAAGNPNGSTKEITKRLLENGADIHKQSLKDGRTSLHYAFASGNSDFIDAVVENTSELSMIPWFKVDYGNQTPLGVIQNEGGLQAELGLSITKGLVSMQRDVKPGVITPDGKKVSYQLCLIGGGPAGASVMIATIDKLVKTAEKIKTDFLSKISFVIVDKNRVLGTGTPYADESNSDLSILNVTANSMSIVVGKENDFVDWLQYKKDSGQLEDVLGKALKYGLIKADVREQGFYPRTTYGKYVAERCQEYIDLGRSSGLNITTLTQSEVVKEIPGTSGSPMKLEIKDITKESPAKEIECTNIFFGTGHWKEKSNTQKPYETAPGYIQYPVNLWKPEFSDIFPKESASGDKSSIAILGSSLSALDALLSWCLHPDVGTLTQDGDKIDYTPKNKDMKIFVFSRRGIWPKVRPITKGNYELRYFSFKKIKALCSIKQVSLNEAVRLLNKELTIGLGRDVNIDDEANPLASKKNKYKNNPFAIVEKDKNRALEGDGRTAGSLAVRWYEITSQIVPSIALLLTQFTEEDRTKFFKFYNPKLLVSGAPMPVSSAKFILALHDLGILNLYRIDGEPQLLKDGKTIQVNYLDADDKKHSQSFETMLSTTGLANTYSEDISELTQNLIKDGRISFSPEDSQDGTKENYAFITNDNTYRLLDDRKQSSLSRTSIGYHNFASLFDLQSVPGTVEHAGILSEVYNSLFTFLLAGDRKWSLETQEQLAEIDELGLTVPKVQPDPSQNIDEKLIDLMPDDTDNFSGPE